MFGRKDLKNIEEKKSQLMDKMDNVSMESDEFEQALKNYKMLVETEENIRDGRNKRSSERVSTAVKVGGFVVSAVAAVGVPIYLADKAYQHDQNLEMKNGTIWNLIGKRFDKNN